MNQSVSRCYGMSRCSKERRARAPVDEAMISSGGCLLARSISEKKGAIASSLSPLVVCLFFSFFLIQKKKEDTGTDHLASLCKWFEPKAFSKSKTRKREREKKPSQSLFFSSPFSFFFLFRRRCHCRRFSSFSLSLFLFPLFSRLFPRAPIRSHAPLLLSLSLSLSRNQK